MKTISSLLALVCLAAIALAEPPVPGAPYRIQSVGSSLVVDNESGLANAGNHVRCSRFLPSGFLIISHINMFPTNDVEPGPQAQLISVELVGTNIDAGVNAGSGIYKFKFPLIGVGAYVRGPGVGPGLTAQNFSTEFVVTEVALGAFTITYPFSDFALTSPTATSIPISLQPLNANNTLQQWRFIPVSL